MTALQARLDAAFAAHPERKTLGDFRAPAWLVKAEREALAYASRIVTPHAEIAAMYPGKAELIPWQLPKVAGRRALGKRRQAHRVPGANHRAQRAPMNCARRRGRLASKSCWSATTSRAAISGTASRRSAPAKTGSATLPPSCSRRWSKSGRGICLPRSRRGVPVIATAACGLGAREGVTTIPAGRRGRTDRRAAKVRQSGFALDRNIAAPALVPPPAVGRSNRISRVSVKSVRVGAAHQHKKIEPLRSRRSPRGRNPSRALWFNLRGRLPPPDPSRPCGLERSTAPQRGAVTRRNVPRVCYSPRKKGENGWSRLPRFMRAFWR